MFARLAVILLKLIDAIVTRERAKMHVECSGMWYRLAGKMRRPSRSGQMTPPKDLLVLFMTGWTEGRSPLQRLHRQPRRVAPAPS